ncbi:MAG: BBP7 family outer membrane beta-barrel protein [Planctomycetota bacterium]
MSVDGKLPYRIRRRPTLSVGPSLLLYCCVRGWEPLGLTYWVRVSCFAMSLALWLVCFASIATGQAPGTLDPYATSSAPAANLGWNPIASQSRLFGAPVGVASDRGQGFLSSAGWLSSDTFLVAPRQQQDRLWFRTEYLRWWTERMTTPVLVTTSPSGTAREEAGVLGFSDTDSLFGGGEIGDDTTDGLRLRAGFFPTPSATFGIETEYFLLGEQNAGFSGGGGDRILARPFFDITQGRETAQLINFPATAVGSLRISSESKLNSFFVGGRASLLPTGGGSVCNHDRVDWLVGFRMIRLRDRLNFREDVESVVVGAEGELDLTDTFQTRNRFSGLQLGVVHQANLNRVFLESMLRVAVGVNEQTVNIRGSSTLTELGDSETYPVGLLAVDTNSGHRQRDRFSVVPEVGVTLGAHATSWLTVTGGYHLLYFPAVVRAGDQIETDINPGLLAPPDDPLVGAARPRFEYEETDYWAQGLTLGAQLRF